MIRFPIPSPALRLVLRPRPIATMSLKRKAADQPDGAKKPKQNA
jgi:hypothetical protein